MDLTQLRSFVTVARLGHLTRAAEAVHLSQPALSGHIKALEEELAVQLFERTPSGMAITTPGKRLLVHAEAIVGRVQQMQHTARALSDQLTGKLRLGTVLDPAFLRVGELLMTTYERYPEIVLELHHVVSHEALDGVRDGTLDASFYFGEVPDDMSGVRLRDVAYRVVIPEAWRNLKQAKLTELADSPWVVTPERSSHRRLVEELFAEQGVAFPTRTVEADNESVIINLVESGVGVGLVRDELAEASADGGRTIGLPRLAMDTNLWLVHQPARADDPLIGAIVEILVEMWNDARHPPARAAA